MEFIRHATVSNEHHGLRLDAALAQIYPEFSRQQLSTWIKAGNIRLNDKVCKPREKIKTGDEIALQVTIAPPDNNLLPEDIPLNIAFEDKCLLIVNKPAGLVVHPGAGNPRHTLVNALVHYDASLQNLPRAGIIHRLDKDTSGLLLVAKTLPAYTALVRAMQAREIDRQYLTLVHGLVSTGNSITTPFGRHPKNRLKMAVLAQGKAAVTHYSVKKRYADCTLLNVKLETGRTHQIRVHMQYINHPVVGDPIYGKRKLPTHSSSFFNRQALHAYYLSLHHPTTNEILTIEAPLPDDFALLLTIMDESLEH